MGFLQLIREKLGAAPDMPDSAVLTQALGEALDKLNKIDARIAELKSGISLDVARSDDAAAATRAQLAELRSEREG